MRWFKRRGNNLVIKVPFPVTTLDSLKKGKCPDCGGKEWLAGPRGGAAQNIKCANPDCGSRFNVGPGLRERIG